MSINGLVGSAASRPSAPGPGGTAAGASQLPGAARRFQRAIFLKFVQPAGKLPAEFLAGRYQGTDAAAGVGRGGRLRDRDQLLGDHPVPAVEHPGAALQDAATVLRRVENLREFLQLQTQQATGRGMATAANQSELLPQALRQQQPGRTGPATAGVAAQLQRVVVEQAILDAQRVEPVRRPDFERDFRPATVAHQALSRQAEIIHFGWRCIAPAGRAGRQQSQRQQQ